jgi:5,10-methenyltetrahydrofolate synthetase
LAAPLEKVALRRVLRARRRDLDPAQKALWDARIGAQVLAWARANEVATLAVYWPLAGEPDLAQAYAELARAGVRLALPVVLGRDCALAFADWVPGEAMQEDQMGVAVPRQQRLVARPGALLVPCLGFNAERFRLGYGGGFYDRTLEAAPRPLTAGVAYACLEAPFTSAAHDVALDSIITEASELTP